MAAKFKVYDLCLIRSRLTHIRDAECIPKNDFVRLLPASTKPSYRAAFSFFPAVNLTLLLALILIASPVLGFLPFLAFRFANENVPKPIRVSLPSFLAVLATASEKDLIVFSAWAFEIPASFASFSTSYALVIFTLLILDKGLMTRSIPQIFLIETLFIQPDSANSVTGRPDRKSVV